MIIKAIPSGPFETNAYVLGCPDFHLALIIDPAPDSSASIIDYLTKNNLKPEKILLTHSHWDHIADVACLKKHYHIPVLIHEEDAKNLEMPGSDGLPCWISIEGIKADSYLNEGDNINCGNLSFIVIHTPGHSPGCICLYEEKQNVLISGDTLFKGSIGNLSFATARPKKMWESLKKLGKLPPSTKVYPGHGPSTTIGIESWLSNAENFFGN
jgi:glyoxylase-like metal-dependent hydrolase (beta-lactamase superfamily II)